MPKPTTTADTTTTANVHAAQLPAVTTFFGTDGVMVVQIDTGGTPGRVRVNLNEAPIYDADPEPHPRRFSDTTDYKAARRGVPYVLTAQGLSALSPIGNPVNPIRWNQNSPTRYSGVSPTTDRIYEIKRGDSTRPLWWISVMAPGQLPRGLTGITNLDAARAYCSAHDHATEAAQ